MGKWKNLWNKLRWSLWLLPSPIVTVSIPLAVVRGMLSTIAGSMIFAVGVTLKSDCTGRG